MKSKNNNNLKVNLNAMKEFKASDIENKSEMNLQQSADKTTETEVQAETPKVEKPKLTKKQEWINTLKFTLFSISAGVIQMLSFTLLSELVFHDADNQYGVSYFISLALSVIWNFTFNRKFTFKSAKNVPIAMMLVFVYYCAFTPLSIWWGVELVENLGWNNYLVLFLTMVVNMATEYLWTRYVVYRNDLNTATKKEHKSKDNKKDEKTKQIKKERKVKENKKNKKLKDSNKTASENLFEDLKMEENINQNN